MKYTSILFGISATLILYTIFHPSTPTYHQSLGIPPLSKSLDSISKRMDSSLRVVNEWNRRTDSFLKYQDLFEKSNKKSDNYYILYLKDDKQRHRVLFNKYLDSMGYYLKKVNEWK